MIRTFLRPNLIKRFNIRTKCDLNCKERCVNLMSQQVEPLNKIANHTKIITIIAVANFIAPILIIGANSISYLIIRLMY
jgi:hypothetical protein